MAKLPNSLAGTVTVSTLAPPPATMMSSDLAASDTRTGADVAATREPEPASSATIAGPVIGGVGALTLAAYGLVTVVVCLRQRRRYHVNETAGDSKTPCQNRFSEAEHVTIPRPDKLVEQRSPEAPACQWQPPLSPQQPDYAAAPRMPKVIMSLYDPDNPATYPPPLSVILGQPVAPWAAPGWDDTTECSS
ncbi:hypothetical protein GY45DRAFT_1424130 [Cubamyces sp. BRFM 1775]|nr:hypothetical protein GY45DRAFT_1424130 [Cubamyces sp. BRFM 1775]